MTDCTLRCRSCDEFAIVDVEGFCVGCTPELPQPMWSKTDELMARAQADAMRGMSVFGPRLRVVPDERNGK